MPYVIQGQKMRRGVGQAPCPSMQQLQGVTDPTDPCQSAGVTNAMLDNIKNFFYQAGMDNAAPAASPLSSLPSWALPVGIGLVVLMLLKKR